MVKVAHSPGIAATLIVPPWDSTMDLPNRQAEAGVAVLAVAGGVGEPKQSKTRACCSAVNPGPLSAIVVRT